ncbi:PAS domain-containing protein, partial [Deinococcus sp.]|uniref:PAS domain-containing protein n=1 Tax=Deinococcus sp. TaxID=47478 RepID=UPI002869C1E6
MGLNAVSPDFSALIQAMPNPVVLVREDGSAAMNPAARSRLLQLGVPEDWRQLVHTQALPAVSAAVAAACQGQTDTLAVKLPDMIAPGQLTVAPGGPGSALLHLHVGRDPLETALELLDTLNLGVTVQGADSRILYANGAAQHILGQSLDQLMARDSMDLDPEWRAVHPSGEPFPGETRPAMVALQTGVVQRNVPMGIFHPPSGSWRWLRVTAVPRRVPGTAQVRQVTVILDDVTEAQRTE